MSATPPELKTPVFEAEGYGGLPLLPHYKANLYSGGLGGRLVGAKKLPVGPDA